MDKYHIIMPELTTDSYGSEVFLAVNGTFAGYMVISIRYNLMLYLLSGN